jgi:hypothetical protein
MKLVKEHISFTHHKNPLRAIGLGIFVERNFNTYREAVEFLYKFLSLFRKKICKKCKQ